MSESLAYALIHNKTPKPNNWTFRTSQATGAHTGSPRRRLSSYSYECEFKSWCGRFLTLPMMSQRACWLTGIHQTVCGRTISLRTNRVVNSQAYRAIHRVVMTLGWAPWPAHRLAAWISSTHRLSTSPPQMPITSPPGCASAWRIAPSREASRNSGCSSVRGPNENSIARRNLDAVAPCTPWK